MAKRRILFLCTGNSCRSQMAEGLVNHLLSTEWQAFSAGTQPTGYVHSLAIKAMAEVGIDISANESKSTEFFLRDAFDLVITVCDQAAEDCPTWLGEGEVAHISFPDPAEARGTDTEIMNVFRFVRDDIRHRIFFLLESGGSLPEAPVRK